VTAAMSPSLQGKVCLVTGAARGIGRGIALQLGEAGATVYITGRTKSNLEECAQEIKNRGGRAVPVVLDHDNDSDVEKLFERIKSEENGRLDLLVNNAYAGVHTIFSNMGKMFWEMDPVDTWDKINGVGLRGHYICTTLAARMMVLRKQGLIVTVSSSGGLKYLFNVPYGVGKTACDRMAADCGLEMKSTNVAMISLWPGPVKTEYITKRQAEEDNSKTDGENVDSRLKDVSKVGESIEFTGKVIVQLAAESNIMDRTGKIINTADVAREYGIKDIDGTVPIDLRQLNAVLTYEGYSGLAAWIPDCVRIPHWIMHFLSYKF